MAKCICFYALDDLSTSWGGVVQVPTTLMAAVDASVGIKTAVNFHEKKNKLGTYCPPLAVFLDRAFLRTLDSRNLSNGAAEMLKMVRFLNHRCFRPARSPVLSWPRLASTPGK